jgi:hypothetical protein
MSEDHNRLLYVISARQSLTWASFCEAVDKLTADNPTTFQLTDRTATLGGLLHCLEALGHCDTYYHEGQSKTTITLPALCRLPIAGLPVAVLTGLRWQDTQVQLRESKQVRNGTVQIITKNYSGLLGLIPDKLLVRAETENILLDFCNDMKLMYPLIPPAWTLINWCGTLKEYEETLDYRIAHDLNWPRYDFCPEFSVFTYRHNQSLPRYSRYRNPTTGLPLHIFFRNEKGAEVDLRWGYYLFLNAHEITVTAYDAKRYRLCLPARIPLPTIISRIICLCSGNPPIYAKMELLSLGIKCNDWLIFNDVPPQIAIPALAKVGQKPAHIDIK